MRNPDGRSPGTTPWSSADAPRSPVREASTLAGQTVGHWRLLRHLGEGAFGAVYEAQHASIAGRGAAVKVLHPHMSLQPAIKHRFVNEASAASRAEHENIIQVFDGGFTDDGICYVVMELLKGLTLRQVMDRGRVDVGRALNIGIQVARALEAAHKESIVHRDLKPDNIFVVPRVTNAEFVKVLDFGIAKLLGDANDAPKTKTGMWLGTPGYMSPEQWQTLSDIDGRADIYALGVILYELLVGEQPFKGENQFLVMMGHLNEPVPEPPAFAALPSSVRRLLLRAMAKKRDDRPQTMGHVVEAMDAILAGRTSGPSSRPNLPVPPSSPARPPTTGRNATITSPSMIEERPFPARADTLRSASRASEAPPAGATMILPSKRRTYPEVVAVPPAAKPGATIVVGSAAAGAEEHRRQLQQDPLRIDAYRSLHRHYLELNQLDAAWCVAGALLALGRANGDEAAFYDRLRPKKLPSARQPLTAEMWSRNLVHPDEDPDIDGIFSAIWRAAAFLRAGGRAHFGLKKKDRIDLAGHPAPLSKVLSYASRVLAPIVPEVYLLSGPPGGIRIANCKEDDVLLPSLLIGADLLERPVEEHAYRAAKIFTMFRPERYLKLVFPTSTELGIIFLAGLKLAAPSLQLPADAAALAAQYAGQMRPMIDDAGLDSLAQAVQRFLRGSVEGYLSKWSHAAELTSQRAGLLLAGDLAVVARFVQAEATGNGSPQPSERNRELLLYAVSEPYFELRRQLGLGVGQ